MLRRDPKCTRKPRVDYAEAVSEQVLAIKTDRLSEAWRAKQQPGQPTVVAAGLMAEERDPR